MAYTGDVTVGGPPDTRELPGLTCSKLAVGPLDNNAYLLTCTQTGEAALIDVANEAGRLLELIGTGRSAGSSPPTGTSTTGRPSPRCRKPPALTWSRTRTTPWNCRSW